MFLLSLLRYATTYNAHLGPFVMEDFKIHEYTKRINRCLDNLREKHTKLKHKGLVNVLFLWFFPMRSSEKSCLHFLTCNPCETKGATVDSI